MSGSLSGSLGLILVLLGGLFLGITIGAYDQNSVVCKAFGYESTVDRIYLPRGCYLVDKDGYRSEFIFYKDLPGRRGE